MKKQYEVVTVFLAAMIIIAGILFGTGTIFSGWHLVDDHETVRMAELDVKSGTAYSEVLGRSIRQDIQYRWRPLYWVFRVTEAYLFGNNSVVPNCLLCIIGIFTYILLYYSARNIGINIGEAHLFVNVVILGRQFEIWYRIANQENLGLLFLAICLWLVTAQFKKHAYNTPGYDILLTVFAVACAMMKESFLIVLPGIILLRINLEIFSEKKKIGATVKKHWLMCGLTFSVFVFSIIFILRFVGTNSIGYAGVDLDSGLKGMIWNLMRMCNNSLKAYLIVAVLCCVPLVLSWRNVLTLEKKDQIITGIFLIFSIYIIAGEMFLYAKSNMWDRYLVPFTVGYGLFLLILAERLLRNKLLRAAYWLILCVFLGTRLYLSVFTRAYDYANEGRQIQNILSYITENVSPDAKIVTAIDEGESDMAMSIYLELAGRKNVYQYDAEADVWEDVYQFYGETEEFRAGDEGDIYILEGRRDNSDIEEKYLSDSGWERVEIGNRFDFWVNKRKQQMSGGQGY